MGNPNSRVISKGGEEERVQFKGNEERVQFKGEEQRVRSPEPLPHPMNVDGMIVSLERTDTLAADTVAGTAMDNKHECLIKEFQSLDPPVFRGSSDISVAEEWFHEIEKKLGLMRLTDEERLILATSMLKGEASHWWDINKDTIVDEGMTWRQFEDSFLERYYPFSDRNMKKIELMRLARMEYLDSVEKKRDKGKAESSEIAVEMEKLEAKEMGDVRKCSPLREEEQKLVQDGAIEVRNLMDGGQGKTKSSNLNSEKPEVAAVEVTGQSEAAHTVINLEEQQKQLEQNMKQYVHQLLSHQVQQIYQQKQQPLALVESNVKGQRQWQIQKHPEVASIDATANMIETQQQPAVGHVGSSIVERLNEVQLQTKRYMHRVLVQKVQQLLKRKHQQLQPEHRQQLQPEHQQLQHWQQLIQKQKELHQHMQRQQQQLQPQKQQQLQQQQQQHLHQQQKQQQQQLHQQRQQQPQKQQQQQQQKPHDHQTPQKERKQNKKRKHHEAEVALVQVNMEEFWANERNRKKSKKSVKQVQMAEKQHSHHHHPYTKPQQAPQ